MDFHLFSSLAVNNGQWHWITVQNIPNVHPKGEWDLQDEKGGWKSPLSLLSILLLGAGKARRGAALQSVDDLEILQCQEVAVTSCDLLIHGPRRLSWGWCLTHRRFSRNVYRLKWWMARRFHTFKKYKGWRNLPSSGVHRVPRNLTAIVNSLIKRADTSWWKILSQNTPAYFLFNEHDGNKSLCTIKVQILAPLEK
jgi:hypothetical protein